MLLECGGYLSVKGDGNLLKLCQLFGKACNQNSCRLHLKWKKIKKRKKEKGKEKEKEKEKED